LKFCDMTHAYTAKSGGIRTFIDAKRAWLLRETRSEHILIVPGPRDRFVDEGRARTYEIAAPLIPGLLPYRMMLRAGAVERILASERPDLIEFGSPYFLSGAAHRHRRRHPCAVVGFYHTDFPSAYIEPTLRRIAGPAMGRLAKRLALSYARAVYSGCDLTVTASPALARMLRALGVQSVPVVPLGVDAETFHPRHRDQALRESLGVGVGDVLLVYAGRFDSEKRVDLLVQAFRRLGPSMKAHMLLIGHGPARRSLEEAATQTPRLWVRSYVADHTDLARILASSDIYVSAGPHETFALSVLEAQACGLPVVGVRAGALIERVDAETGVLGSPGSAEEFARNIAYVSANGMSEMGRAARRRVESQFTWGQTFPRLFAIYSDAICNRSQGLPAASQSGTSVVAARGGK
jgi:alpha-1,6-mannosyltransferase